MATMITIETLKKLYDVFPAAEAMNLEGAVLKSAFDLVAPKDDWRGPINAEADAEAAGFDAEVIARAIVHFTATEATHEPGSYPGAVRFRAAGYRAGPAA